MVNGKDESIKVPGFFNSLFQGVAEDGMTIVILLVLAMSRVPIVDFKTVFIHVNDA